MWDRRLWPLPRPKFAYRALTASYDYSVGDLVYYGGSILADAYVNYIHNDSGNVECRLLSQVPSTYWEFDGRYTIFEVFEYLSDHVTQHDLEIAGLIEAGHRIAPRMWPGSHSAPGGVFTASALALLTAACPLPAAFPAYYAACAVGARAPAPALPFLGTATATALSRHPAPAAF